ncbi:MAG: 5-deoxy-glucuronate isomerase [Propionibacteriales bacterium]|nr:5-deoxy-glucuronate isomerase [Propionibacteriales bacterium]
MAEARHLRAGTTARGPWALEVLPELAGWEWSGLRVLELSAGGRREFSTEGHEMVVLPLSGSCTVRCDDAVFELRGRESVFTGVSDFVYLPRDSQVMVETASGGRFAFPSARCTRRLPARYGAAEDVPVEIRGSGASSRQVNNFCAAGVFEADKLIAVEVLTPAGNWSSYPPHKHDEDRPGEECVLEEIYYFEVRAEDAAPDRVDGQSAKAHDPPDTSGGRARPTRAGIAYQRVYGTAERPADLLAEVRSGDVVTIPHGWHGPSMAAPGYDLYYLNVMAGPSDERAWLICDDPAHAWVRSTWEAQSVDPRLPMTAAIEEAGDRR